MPARNFDGQRVRLRRRALELTQAELAKALGVSRAAVASWEKGAAKPDGERLPAIAEALKSDLDALFPRDGAPDLADLRCDAGYAQYEVGPLVGARGDGPVGDAERGTRPLDESLIDPLAAAYGVSPDVLLAAQERSFGRHAADSRRVPRTLAEKINYLMERTFGDGQPVPSNAEIARAVNAHAGAVVISEAEVGDLRSGAELAATQVVCEGLGEFFGVTPSFFLSDEAVARQVVEGLTLLASVRRGEVNAVAARGLGKEGLTPDVLAFVNDMVADLQKRGLPGSDGR